MLSRVAGIVLVALTIACWPDARARERAKPYAGMLFYNLLIALVLAKVGLDGERSGPCCGRLSFSTSSRRSLLLGLGPSCGRQKPSDRMS